MAQVTYRGVQYNTETRVQHQKQQEPQQKQLVYRGLKVKNKEETRWDLTMAYKMSEIFDYYYDKYKNVLAIVQSDGKVPPKLWKDPTKKEKPKTKKK